MRWIVKTLEDAGHETWAVGGAVRDVLLGRESVDWDFATRARPKEVRRVFRRTVPIGIEHGTVGVLARDGTLYEVTTFRRDVETHGRHAVVEFADRLDEDLARRDFTINAVAWHPLRDELADPFGGVQDLDRRLLRTVGAPQDRFSEDYLRVLRALRFAARFGLRIDEPTWNALVAAIPRLDVLSVERVREELMKVLEKDPRPSGALALYAASGALGRLHGELAFLGGVAPEGPGAGVDAWARACLAADLLPPHRPLLRLAALLMDATGTAREEGAAEPLRPDPSSGGERAGVAERAGGRAAALMSRLRFSNADVDRVVGLVRGGGAPPGVEATPADLRRWASRVGRDRLPDLARLWGARARVRAALGGRVADTPGDRIADTSGGRVADTPGDRVADTSGTEDPVAATVRDVRRLRREMATRPPLEVGDLAVDGRDLIRLGLRPGPRFGAILQGLLERVLEDPSLNRRERLETMVSEEILGGGPPDGEG